MYEFIYGDIKIRVKNSKQGSTYSQICKKCKYFKNKLCQEGLYNLVLTTDGMLRMCKHRLDISLDVSDKPRNEIKNDLEKMFENYKSTFHEVLLV